MSKKKKTSSSQPAPTASPQAEALARFRPLLSDEDYSLLLAELDRPLYTTIRMNPLKVNPSAAVLDCAQRYGWTTVPVPYCSTGWWVTAAAVAPSQTLEHRMGDFYIQDAASMLPVELFDWDGLDAPLVLDMAASPGGKTTHLVSKTGDHGLVVANDSSPSRITALRLVLENWGAVNTVVTRFPGEKIGTWYPEIFDRVLLDAPCSMQGLHTIDSHPMRAITEKEQQALAQRQAALLKSAFRALKPGGQLVYSTCTLEPGEDEGVLDELLRQFPETAVIEDLSARLPVPAPALTSAGERRFHPAVAGAARLWPHRFGTSGFFAALISKRASTGGKSMALPPGVVPPLAAEEYPPTRSFERTGFQPLAVRETAALAAQLESAYGFDLPGVLSDQGLALLRASLLREKPIIAVPELYLSRFAELPVQSAGLVLGEEGPEAFIPDHDWLARFRGRFERGRWTLPADLRTAWLRGEDIRIGLTNRFARGFVVLVEDEAGRFLGRGRVTVDRLKNLLPRRFVV